MRFSVKVVPGSSQDAIVGWLEESLKIKVQSPAEGGKANASVKAILASALGLASAEIEIISGKTSARKVIEIDRLSDTEVRNRLVNRLP